MVYLHIVWLLLIVYLLYSNWLQKIRTTRVTEDVHELISRNSEHFDGITSHVRSIKSAIESMQLSAIKVNLEKGLSSPDVTVEKVDAEDPHDKIVLLGDLIPPE